MGPRLTALPTTTETTAQVGVRQVVTLVFSVINDDLKGQTAKVNTNIEINLSTHT